jgi:hypothetical protein
MEVMLLEPQVVLEDSAVVGVQPILAAQVYFIFITKEKQ